MKSDEIKKKIKDIKIIEIEIDKLKEYEILIPPYEKFLNDEKLSYLSEYIVELRNGKSKFLNDIRKNENILREWDEKCERFFESENKENQEAIKNILLRKIQEEIELLKHKYQENIGEYQSIKDSLQANAYKFPT